MFFRLFKEGFLFAVNSVIVNKLRTFLSLFGITIGIFSIISVFTALDWMEKSIRDSVSTLGDNVIYVQKFPWSFDPNLAWWDIIKWPSISDRDYQSILKKSTKSETACFLAFQPEKIKYKKNIASDVTVAAITLEFQNIRSFEIDKGRYFSPFEASSGKNVALIGAEIAERLFEKTDPVGKEISIAGFKTTIIGVLKKEGKGGISDNGMDELTLVPLNFGKSFINMKNRFIEAQLMIKAKPGVAIQELSDETTMILRAASSLRPGRKIKFLSQQGKYAFTGIRFYFCCNKHRRLDYRRIFNSCRRFWNCKYHVCFSKGTNKYYWYTESSRSKEIFYTSAISGRIHAAFYNRRIAWSIHDISWHPGNKLSLGSEYVSHFGNIFLAVFISGIIGVVAGYAPANAASKMNPVEAIGFSF